ncbi:MAG: hypothetical protein JST90_18845 [Bacteroidetes bacterium]|nr:hypothetical protein [Bacteroidota bacterium]
MNLTPKIYKNLELVLCRLHTHFNNTEGHPINYDQLKELCKLSEHEMSDVVKILYKNGHIDLLSDVVAIKSQGIEANLYKFYARERRSYIKDVGSVYVFYGAIAISLVVGIYSIYSQVVKSNSLENRIEVLESKGQQSIK